MRGTGLADPYLKLDWAKRHLDALDADLCRRRAWGQSRASSLRKPLIALIQDTKFAQSGCAEAGSPISQSFCRARLSKPSAVVETLEPPTSTTCSGARACASA